MLIKKYSEININVNTCYPNNEILYLKQNDNLSRSVIFQLFKGSDKFFITENMVVRYVLRKSNDTYIIKDVDKNNIQDNEITIIFTSCDLSVSGIMFIELIISEGETVISSQVIKANVISNAYNNADIINCDNYESFIDALNKITPLISQIQQEIEKAEKVTNKLPEVNQALQNVIDATKKAEQVAESVPQISEDLQRQINLKLDISTYNTDKNNI